MTFSESRRMSRSSNPSAWRFHRSRFTSREVGPATIVVLVVALALLWAVARPAQGSLANDVGQFFGAESILLLSIGLVLISTLPWVEAYFDGIDRAAIWHRRVASTGLLLLVPHISLSSGRGSTLGSPLAVTGALGMLALVLWAVLPRWRSLAPAPLRTLIFAARDAPGIRQLRGRFGGYERWRAVHRTTGLFVTAGFVHGVLDGTTFDGAPVLRWTYVVVGGIGVGFYMYRELFARFFQSLHDYQVESVQEVGKGLVEIAMRPLGRAVDFVPGQFAMVHLEAKDGWHRHPFTISSAPNEGVVRVTVKALGDYTSRLQELIQPGMPAVIGGPHGRFSHWRGTDRQLWIAGGVGVAPFISWLRGLDGELPHHVDFFYSNDGAAPFAEEIRLIADRYPSLRVHTIDTRVQGRLTSQQVLGAVEGDPRDLSVFMCGPHGMLRSFQYELVRSGVQARRIHREYFDWR